MQYLQEERELTCRWAHNKIFGRRTIKISVGKHEYERCPYEEVRLEYGKTGKEYRIQLDEGKDLVWCTMCFGRDAQLQPHLERTLCLGKGLGELKDALWEGYGISFAPVLFVTEEALTQCCL